MTATRDQTIDMTRGMAMLLVIFAHTLLVFFWQRPDGQFDTHAYEAARFIQAFHMPAFYFISGLTALKLAQRPFSHTAISGLTLILFAFVTHIFTLPFIELVHPQYDGGMAKAVALLRPILTGTDFPLILPWFLISLAVVQCLAWLYLKAGPIGKTYLVVGLLALHLAHILGLKVIYMSNSWAVGLFFFLAGRWFAQIKKPALPTLVAALAAGLAVLVTFALYPLNQGCLLNPLNTCNPSPFPSFGVSIVGGAVGFIPLFLITALVGIAGLVLISEALKKTPMAAALSWIGRNTLSLMIINGLCLVIVNPFLSALLPTQPWSWFVSSVLVTGAHLAILPLAIPLFNWLQAACRLGSEQLYQAVQAGSRRLIRATAK